MSWPPEVYNECHAYRARQRVVSGLPPAAADLPQDAAELQHKTSMYLADLTHRTFDDTVQHLSGSRATPQCDDGAEGDAWGRVFIDDVAGRRLRIDMYYSVQWQAPGPCQ